MYEAKQARNRDHRTAMDEPDGAEDPLLVQVMKWSEHTMKEGPAG
jgi:hypothetical protein